MNDRAHRVVGVLPPLPSFPEEADIYLPTAACPLRISHDGDSSRSMHLVSVLGRVSRLHEDDANAVQSELASLTARLGVSGADDAPLDYSAVPVHDDLTGRFRPTLSVLVASTVFLLLSLCLSVGGLMVANTLRRRDSLLLMTALGAWRGRLFRQFASEALLLSAIGALAGVGLASQTVPLLAGLASRFTPRAVEIQFDHTSLWFAGGVTLIVSLLIGSIVALTAGSTLTATDSLGHRRYVSTRPRLFKSLVVVHIAVSFALLVGAGLMLRSLVNLERIQTGLRVDDVLTLRLSSDFIEYPQPAMQAALFHRLLTTIESLPEVTSVGMSGALPLAGSGNVGEATFEIAGRPAASSASRPLASLQNVSGGYFSTVGVDVVEGRAFSDDEGAAESVVIINERMARRYWPSGGAVGQRVRAGQGPWATVVGVVSDARQRLAEPPMDEIYRPISQMPLFGFISPQIRYLVRGTLPQEQLAERIRAALREVAPQHAVDNIGSLSRTRAFSLAPMRTTTTLIALFAGIALSISTIGLCGVAGASVSARTAALALQLALGASPWGLWRGVLREGVMLSLAGLAIGVGLAVPLARSLAGLLFEVEPNDAGTFVAVGVLLMAATIAGCLAPARRAALVNPNTALRA
jgi:predicted permease